MIKKLIYKIAILGMRTIYLILKLFPIKNKITMISRQADNISLDFSLLEQELLSTYSNYQVVVLSKHFDEKDSVWKKIKYCFHILRQMFHIATSKVVILDSYCMPISILNHKKELTVIQIWHALGSLKKFGYSVISKEEGSKLYQIGRMHRNYDIILTSSKLSRQYFSEAFGYDESKLEILPLPRTDKLKDKKYMSLKKREIVEKYPEVRTKKNILYAPTFRKDGSDIKYINKLIEAIDYSKYNLILKLHPLTNIKIEQEKNILDYSFSTLDMFSVADYVITDYSAIVFEAALMGKPLFFYCYDLDKYGKKRDFYIDYKKEMPGIISKNSKEIVSSIEQDNYDIKKISKFAEKYVEYKGNATKKLVKLIGKYI